MKSVAKNIQLASFDDLFKTDEERLADTQERVQELPVEKLTPFPNHPFKVLDDEKMQETVDSIKEYGVLVPLLVRSKEDGNFEIVSGHRRHHASILAGKAEVPAIVRELDDDAAILIMVDSNLQRETILPSEKAFAYKMKLDAMNRQGERNDLTSRQVVGKLESADIVGKDIGESGRQVQRYIRLTNLTPDLLELVDSKAIAFNAAVEVSYLSEEEQGLLSDAIEREETSPSLSQAKRLKKYSQEGKLSEDVMDVIMTEEKAAETKLVLRGEKIDKYFPPKTSPAEKERIILKQLEAWHKKRTKEREH